MWYIVRLDSSRVATLDKVRSATLVSSDDPTRVKSNYIPVKTTILRQIERCQGVYVRLVISMFRVSYRLLLCGPTCSLWWTYLYQMCFTDLLWAWRCAKLFIAHAPKPSASFEDRMGLSPSSGCLSVVDMSIKVTKRVAERF